MDDKVLTFGEVFRQLRESGLVSESQEKAAALRLESYGEVQDRESTPWYIKALVAVGAWAAAVFFLVSVGMAFMFELDDKMFILIGLASIAVATILRRVAKEDSIFLAQLAFALCITGHGLTIYGVGEESDSVGVVALVVTVLFGLLYWLYKDGAYRVLGTLMVAGTFSVWFLSENDLNHFIHLLILVEALGVGVLFMKQDLPAFLRPLALGLAVSLGLTPFFVLLPAHELVTPFWPSSIILALGLICLYFAMAKREGGFRYEPLGFAFTATLLFSFSTPGILAAIALMVLGHYLADRVLLGLGFMLLPVFITIYYYSLTMDLLTKSGILFASGAFLIIIRIIISSRPWAREAVEEAGGEVE